jgi:hypothetical protein
MMCYRMGGNASFSLYEPRVTHRAPTDTQIGECVCNGCGSPFRPKRSCQKQCSGRFNSFSFPARRW